MYYEKEQQDDGTILLKKNMLTLEDYDVQMSSNGDIILKKKKKITVVDDINSVDFNFSKVLECSFNVVLNYTSILKKVYETISDGSKIIKHSMLNIVVSCKTDKGFMYMNDLGISVQRCDANKTLKEIISQCTKHRISISLKIQLSNDNIVHVSIQQ
jgi:hypothetical protein